MDGITNSVENMIPINKEAESWAMSSQGLQAIESALTLAESMNAALQNARVIDSQKLRIPLNL